MNSGKEVKSMKKRLVALALTAVLCVTAFGGCQTSGGGESSQAAESSSSVSSESSATEDSSENSGAETGNTANGDPAFMKFDEVIEVHVGQGVDPLDTTLPEGDSVDNNQYTRYLLDNFNIKVVADWTAANGNDFDQKVALCIASNSLPDAVVTGRQYMLRAAKSDMLYDLTELFDQYCSEQGKGIMDSTDGRAYEDASYNGKMVALLGIEVECGGISNLNIRKDWLDELAWKSLPLWMRLKRSPRRLWKPSLPAKRLWPFWDPASPPSPTGPSWVPAACSMALTLCSLLMMCTLAIGWRMKMAM